MAGNQYNELYPNYGCAIQSNFAAMVEDPDDFLAPRGLAPATGASRSAVIRKYNEGGWSQEEQVFPDAAITPSTQ
jgi:pilus assembly protein CpaD